MTTPPNHVPKGPLKGVRVLEMAGIGPAPFCGMLLSDMGADVIRIDRKESANLGLPVEPRFDVTSRGRSSVTLDLKDPAGIKAVMGLATRADILIEGFRPGVMERLGLGPKQLFEINPRLVFGRVTGWGQDGPLALAAGHDLNYIGLTGAAHAIGTASAPSIPLNLVGDYGGGAVYLAFGIMAALFEATRSGQGQVVDAAITDGAASLMAMFYGHHAAGEWKDERGINSLDGGAPWYSTYETADKKLISIGAIEGKFFKELLRRIGLDPTPWANPHDPGCWPALRAAFQTSFSSRSREHWCQVLEGTDACFSPVLSLSEAPAHAHHQARGTFIDIDGVVQPGPAPRFSRTPGEAQRRAPSPGEFGLAALRDWGFVDDRIKEFEHAGMGWVK